MSERAENISLIKGSGESEIVDRHFSLALAQKM